MEAAKSEVGMPGNLKAEDSWGTESLRVILSFGDGSVRKPIPKLPVEQLLVFQHKLEILSQTPGCFTKAHPEYEGFQLDLSKDGDRTAAVELTKRLPGISRWKPNLVPRVVSEKEFFSHFFGFVAATAEEHFSDAKNLQYFYSDEDDQPEKEKKTRASSDEGIELQDLSPRAEDSVPSKPEKPAEMVPPTPPPKPDHMRTHVEDNISSVHESSTQEKEINVQDVTTPKPVPSEADTTKETRKSSEDRFRDILPGGATTKAMQEAFLKKNVLFFLERNMNSNAVIYEANLVNGKLDEGNPVSVYWILYARNPPVEEELNFIERNSAYGSTTVREEGGRGFKLTLSALPSKAINVSFGDDGLHATTLINGEELELTNIYVNSTTSWGMPKVVHVDVKGRRLDGSFDTERIMP